MKVEPAGPIVTGIASRRAVERDIVSVTITCLIVVAISIGLYFRRWRAIPLTGVPAVMGTVMAFAVAELAFGYLNSSTAFLGSIIIGNGINYAIVLMSRYEEHRARGDDPERGAALRAGRHLAGHAGRVDRGVGRLRVADGDQLPRLLPVRRDGRDGRDLLLARDVFDSSRDAHRARSASTGRRRVGLPMRRWSSPPWPRRTRCCRRCSPLLDRREQKSRAGSGLPHAPLEFGPLATLLRRHAGLVTGPSPCWPSSAWSGCGTSSRTRSSTTSASSTRSWRRPRRRSSSTRTSNDLFGRWPSPTILLADSVDEVEPMKDGDPAPGPRRCPATTSIGQIVTIFDLLPGRARGAAAQARAARADPQADPRSGAGRPERQGEGGSRRRSIRRPSCTSWRRWTCRRSPGARSPRSTARSARWCWSIRPSSGISVWNGRDLLRIASVLQTIKLDNGKVIETSGFAVVFGSMIRSVLHDGPIATVASLIAVLIIIVFTIRPAAAALMALATLVLGVLLMMGGAGWAQRPRDVPELHRAADHVRHRRGVRAERRHPLPRGAQRRRAR